MVILQNIVAVIFVLGVMILIHELGHFLAAKYFDVKVEAFSFGFGPRLLGKKVGETDYRLCLLPLGGYVKMAGEQPSDEHTGDPREFLSKPRWQRLIIAGMGPLFNIILAVGLLVGLFMVHFERLAIQQEPPILGEVEPHSPAAEAGLKDGDKIVEINGTRNPTWEDVNLQTVAAAHQSVDLKILRDGQVLPVSLILASEKHSGIGYAGWSERVRMQVGDNPRDGMPAAVAGLKTNDILLTIDGQDILSRSKLQDYLQEHPGKTVVLEYLRDGQKRNTTLTPIMHESAEDGKAWRIGVVLQPKYDRIVTRLSFSQAMHESVDQNRKNATLIFQFLQGIMQRRMSPKSLEGPIGIARLSGQAARQGSADLILLMSAISLNLGIFNLLPIPILDGGVILMLLFESVMGRDISLPVKERIVQAGFVFLMLLFVFVIYNDIMKSLARS
jgi:regulator of sigma E protease